MMAPHNKQSHSALTAVEIAIVIGLVVIVSSVSSLPYLRWYLPKQRVKQVKADLRRVEVAIQGFFVDDCDELYPARGNYLPLRLTTPMAYLKTLPVDPFSPTKETFRYFNQERRANGTMYILASRGPDGDWDLDGLPDHIKIHDWCWICGKIKIKRGHQSEEFSENQGTGAWVENVEYYIPEDGRRVDVPAFKIAILPKDPKTKGWLTMPQLIEYLAKNNIAIYDPTNGLISDGDIIRTNSR